MDVHVGTTEGEMDLAKEVERLRLQNEKIRLQNETLLLERQVSQLQPSMVLTATPYEPKFGVPTPPTSKKKVAWEDDALPATPSSGSSLEPRRLMQPDKGLLGSALEPEGFVTRRRSKEPKGNDFVKPAAYDGLSSWTDYKAHFETCAEINNWSYKEKGLHLAVSLRGQAQGVYGNLDHNAKDYNSLVKALTERFATPNQTELYRVQLRERRQRASENLSELGQDIRRLTNCAYPTAPHDVRETLAKEQFIDSLVSVDMRLRIKQARPENLNDAVRHAVELEAFGRAERTKFEQQGFSNANFVGSNDTRKSSKDPEIEALKNAVERLEQAVLKMASQQPSQRNGHRARDKDGHKDDFSDRCKPKRKRACFECGSENHIRPSCPKLKPKKVIRDQKQNDKVSNVGFKESGLLVEAKFGSENINCLIDTGANVTIMSSTVWRDSHLPKSCSLLEYENSVRAVCGTPLNILGQATVNLQFGEDMYEAEVIVADVENDVMIGLDFMERYDCSVNIHRKTFTIGNKTHRVTCRGLLGCYGVIVAENKGLPAPPDAVVGETASACLRPRKQDSQILQDEGIEIAAAVDLESRVQQKMNKTSHKNQESFPGTKVTSTGLEEEIKMTVGREYPMKLYDLTVTGMTKRQCKRVKKLLAKFSNASSKSNHRPGKNCPRKQRLRCTQVQINDKTDEALQKDAIQPSQSRRASGIGKFRMKDDKHRSMEGHVAK